jgi:toxin FitB
MRYLLDTNVICEATAKAPDPHVLEWLEENSDESALSALTLGEIWKGLHMMPMGKRRDSISSWAEGLETDFKDVILPIELDTLKVWAKFYAGNESKGLNLVLIDSLLSATALTFGLTVVTRNTRDFPPEIPTLNPWLK